MIERARTLEEVADDIANDLREFAGLCPIKTKGKPGEKPRVVDFEYARWNSEQRQFHIGKIGADVVLKSRQIGCTTYCIVEDLHFALTGEGVQVLIIGHQTDLVEQLFRDITRMVDALVEKRGLPPPLASNKREIIFSHNDSAIRIVEAGATEKVASDRGRSGTIHRLHCTEIAFWREAEATLDGALEALAPGGQVVFESTANGAGGRFYKLVDEALAGRGPYRLHFFPWLQHAEYATAPSEDFDASPRDEHEEAMRELGATDAQIRWWRDKVAASDLERTLANYPYTPRVAFRTAGGRYIEPGACDWALSKTRAPDALHDIVVSVNITDTPEVRRLGKLSVWEGPILGRQYVIGADPSEGIGHDEAAFDVTDVLSGETVAAFAADTIDPENLALAAAWAGRRYNEALIAPERNNDGKTMLLALRSVRSSVTPYHRVYQRPDGKQGWETNGATRPPLFDETAQLVRNRVFISPDPAFASQCGTLVRGDGGKPAAKGKGTKDGARDDRFVAKAISMQVRGSAGSGAALPQPGRLDRRIW